MKGNIAAKRYAGALFRLGQEVGQKEMQRYGSCLSALGEAVEQNSALAEVFSNPVLTAEEKKKVVLALLTVAGGQDMERRFCELLADKNRLSLLPAIATDYCRLVDKAMGIRRGELITAMPLDKDRQSAVKAQLEKQTKSKLELEFKTSKDILGGLILKMDDLVLDASLKAQLNNLRESIKRGE